MKGKGSNMDLLNQNQYQEPQKSKSKKLILVLLMFSIIFAIGILCLMVYLKSNMTIGTTLYINGEQKEIASDLIITGSDGNQYIALRKLAELLGYGFDNSEYNNYGMDTTKCYVKNNTLITGFEQDSNRIYKYEEGTNLDYQYYKLNNNILMYNNNLYIALQDLNLALSMKCESTEKNEIKLYTMEYLASIYQEKLKDSGYSVSTEQNNQKALAYDWIIVTNKDNIYSVLNTNFDEIIGEKYLSIYFDEYNSNFIVSNTSGQHGILATNGTILISLKFDDLEILNYENMLYKVSNNGKYGIMKKDGTMLTKNIIYDEIGYNAEPDKKIVYTLIVPDLDGKGQTIVVKQNGKYGLIYLKDGETYLPCDHLDKLYAVNELGTIEFRVEVEKQTIKLSDYMEARKTHVVNMN